MGLGWGSASLLERGREGFRVPREALAVPRAVLQPGNCSCHIPVSHGDSPGPGITRTPNQGPVPTPPGSPGVTALLL